MSRPVLLFQARDLSTAWMEAFLAITSTGIREAAPLVIAVDGFRKSEVLEVEVIRRELDRDLASRGMYSTHTVANTIFPQKLWNPGRSRSRLFQRYERILPRLHKHRANQYGLYFERLVGLDGQVNQLEHIIKAYNGKVRRRTALQASLFRPDRDHTMQPRRGFPCLDHVAFLPIETGGLEVSALYTMQHVLGKAYGNYLGIARLGRFMAHEMGLELKRLVCTSLIAKLDDSVTKASVAGLTRRLRRAIEGNDARNPRAQ